MRTTIAVSDELLLAAKRRASATGQTLGSVVESALRSYLLAAPHNAGRPRVPVFRAGNGPRPGVDLTSNAALHEALDEGVDVADRR